MSWDPVHALAKKVPRGHVVSYGQVARILHLRGGARTAGRAMAGCPSGRGIPWHRVLGAEGRILIREPLASLQRKLLESEGVIFLSPLRVDFVKHGLSNSALRKLKLSLPRKNKSRVPRRHKS